MSTLSIYSINTNSSESVINTNNTNSSNNILIIFNYETANSYNLNDIKKRRISNNLLCLFTSCNEISLLQGILSNIYKNFKQYDKPFIVLVPFKQPPTEGVRNDGEVTSIICKMELIYNYLDRFNLNFKELLAFQLSKFAIENPDLITDLLIETYNEKGILVHKDINTSEELDGNLIIPHKGNLAYLDCCLQFVYKNKKIPKYISVCFDEKLKDKSLQIISQYKTVNFYRTTPYNVGPYVPRQVLSATSKSKYILLQDSDDVPTTNRFNRLVIPLLKEHTDMVGCHELRIDEILRKIIAFRFPLDVTKALSTSPSHPLFHPTIAIKKNCLLDSGGFSTNRRYANDTQFLLRSFFCMNIKNVDMFLYIRRKRLNSLTTDPKTHLNSNIRLKLDKKWKEDFERIKNGDLKLSDSSLRVQHSAKKPKVNKIYSD